jgi:serine/threonine protein kinase
MDNHNLPINFQLNSKYQIKKVLGQGGFGITYLAEDTFLDKEVCIKELFVTGSSTRGANMTVLTQNMKEFSFADFKERFIQEGKQLAKFNHPNIVKVLDFIEANNTAYVVMEYISGQTLKEKVAYGGPLSAEASQKIIESILDAVEVVHNAGMLHRDIKPDNLIIGDDGRVVLIDFGSARAYSDEKTIAQTAMVSPGYAPLEQYNPNARKGTFTDIYSIGATFYFMLTGEKPLNVTERYSEKLVAPHELNPSVSIQVSSAVMLAMEMKAEDRFQNVADFRLALQQLSTTQNNKDEKKSVTIQNAENNIKIQNKEKDKKYNKVIIFSMIGGFALILLLLFNVFGGNSQNIETSDDTTSEPSYSDGAYGQNDSAKAESKAENKIEDEALFDTTKTEDYSKIEETPSKFEMKNEVKLRKENQKEERIYLRDPEPRKDRANVFYNRKYTLFDHWSDEPIFPDENGIYNIYYSTNEDKRPWSFSGTALELENKTVYKFKNYYNCKSWCDGKKYSNY